jgi:SOS response regulatory protein OraA/RecX
MGDYRVHGFRGGSTALVVRAATVPKKPVSALDAALKLLGGREKSRAQLEAALVIKGHTAQDIRAAIDRCAQLGYLDDQRAAVDLARRLFAEGRSKGDVQRRLEAKGFDPAVAETIPHDELAAAQGLLKSKRVSGVKAARLLLARGFEEELVSTLVDVAEADE